MTGGHTATGGAVKPIHTRFASMLRHAPMMVWMASTDGSVTFVNRKWLTFTGRRLRDELGDGWLRSVHAEDRDRVADQYETAVQSRSPFLFDCRMRRADDSWRRIHHSALPLHEDDGAFAGFVATCVDITTEPVAAAEPERASAPVRLDLSARLEAAREEERRQLARALHDEVGQLLTGIRLEIAAAVQRFRETGSPAEFQVVDRLQAAVGLVDLSIATVQRIATALRPPLLDQMGLSSAIRWEAAVFERRTGIRSRVSSSPAQIEARGHATIMYRILLEALANVARHAAAGTVWITIRERAGQLVMQIRDNGRGISDEAAANPTTLGLVGMRERALAVGGELTVSRHAGGGTKIVVSLPIQPKPRRQAHAAEPDATDPDRR